MNEKDLRRVFQVDSHDKGKHSDNYPLLGTRVKRCTRKPAINGGA